MRSKDIQCIKNKIVYTVHFQNLLKFRTERQFRLNRELLEIIEFFRNEHIPSWLKLLASCHVSFDMKTELLTYTESAWWKYTTAGCNVIVDVFQYADWTSSDQQR